MKFKYKFLLLLISISLIGCLYVSQSYAYWMVTNEQKAANQITSGCFSISFTDKNTVNLTNTYPVDDTVALNSTPYEFTITNTCTIPVSYNVTLTSVNNAGAIDDSNIKYAIYDKTTTKPAAGTALSGTNHTAHSLKTGTLTGGTRSGTSVTAGASVTYNLYLWINSTAGNELMGKTFTANIDVSASPNT